MSIEFLLGVDDTDVLGHQPGTGRLARELAVHLAEAGLAQPVGVVRQQLLVDPRVPYTSHNSPACLLLELADDNGSAARLFDTAARYVAGRAAVGSDPGVCLARRSAVADTVVGFGHRAASEVLCKADALELAEREGLRLTELGGTGDGVIGALAAVGLTAAGNAGRFLEWQGMLRACTGMVTAAALRAYGITVLCIARNGDPVPDAALVDASGRLRPRLIGGRPVLLVEPLDGVWQCFDRKAMHDGHQAHDGHGGRESE